MSSSRPYRRPSAPMARIEAEQLDNGRILVTITRGRRRAFGLSLDEAALLHSTLGRFVPEVTVRRVGAVGPGGES